MSLVDGVIKSKKGFYIGDLCYLLPDKFYDDFWGRQCDFEDGIFEVPDSEYSFAVGSTAYGDGSYVDDLGNTYDVDAGNIGIVPVELCRENPDGCRFVDGKSASFTFEDGLFEFIINDVYIVIDTSDDDDEWDDEDDLTNSYEYEDDDEEEEEEQDDDY